MALGLLFSLILRLVGHRRFFLTFPLFSTNLQMKVTLALALAASASAFVPAMNARAPTHLNFEYGEYDDKLWDNDAKKEIYDKWDPSAPRSPLNFNPFETYKGNSCDASGIFPGEVSVILMQLLRKTK